MVELKPCPFCGRMPKFHKCAELENERLAAHYAGKVGIHCDCGIVTIPFNSVGDAMKAWNRRVNND